MDDQRVLAFVAELTIGSILMVIGMVQFFKALVDAAPSSGRRWRWAAVYAAAWAMTVHAILTLPPAGEPPEPPWPLAMLVVGGWATLSALWFKFYLAIGRAEQRDRGERLLPPDEPLLDRRASWAAAAAGLITGAALWMMRVPHAAVGAMEQENAVGLTLAAIGIFGFLLFIAGGVRLALGPGAQPMTLDEMDEAAAARLMPGTPGAFRKTKIWRRGPATGTRGEMEFTIPELVDAWRSGRVWKQRDFTIAFMMLGGAALMLIGLIGATFVLGGTETRVMTGIILAIAGASTAVGVWRQRRQTRDEAPPDA